MKIAYFNRSQVPSDEEAALEAKYYPKLEDLLAISDVISVNCPLSNSTRNMIDAPEIAKMKDGVFLVNTGRGPVVNEKALIDALSSGKITRAGLDVFDNEPNIKWVDQLQCYDFPANVCQPIFSIRGELCCAASYGLVDRPRMEKCVS